MGNGEGTMGEGFSGIRTKPRERVEAREGRGFGWGRGPLGGRNADNCN